ITNRDHQLAHTDRLRLAQLCRHEIRRRDTNHRQIRVRVIADQLRLKPAPVHERHINLRRAVYNMTIGQNEPVRRKDESGTTATALVRSGSTPAIFAFAPSGYLNVNNRGTYFFRRLNDSARVSI